MERGWILALLRVKTLRFAQQDPPDAPPQWGQALPVVERRATAVRQWLSAMMSALFSGECVQHLEYQLYNAICFEFGVKADQFRCGGNHNPEGSVVKNLHGTKKAELYQSTEQVPVGQQGAVSPATVGTTAFQCGLH